MFQKILLVDDDEASNFLSETILDEMHVASEILLAGNGLDACNLVKQDICPDIIFLDIRMPRMDGFDFLEQLKKLDKCGHTKVIILTSSTRQEEREKALQYTQVLDYFEKPLTEQIVHKVSQEYFK